MASTRSIAMEFLHLSSLAEGLSTGRTLSAVLLGGLGLVMVAIWALSPRHDAAEPPILKPSIPFIGHIINLVRHKSHFHPNIQRAHPSVSAGTLPMLNGKMYVMFDPELIQNAIRARSASMDPFALEFCQKLFDLSNKTNSKIQARPEVFPAMSDALHKSFEPKSLQMMNLQFLGGICRRLEDVSGPAAKIDPSNCGRESLLPDGGGMEVENMYLWVRTVMTTAVCKSLYGNSNPFETDPSLIDHLWTFEESTHLYLLSVFPSVTAPAAFKARHKLQTVMKAYYKSKAAMNDATTSTLIRSRTKVLYDHGLDDDELGQVELIPPQVATTNAVPTFYWMLVFVLSRPELMRTLRSELEAAVVDITDTGADNKGTGTYDGTGGGGHRILSLDIARFDEQLPLMVSCYRETIRMVNSTVGVRRIMQDVSLKDSRGQTFLLKKGVDLHLPAAVTQRNTDIWGADAAEFRADRFVKQQRKAASGENGGSEAAAAERARRLGYFPFGGGKHLCPGRNFAFSEILGFMALILLRFDVEPVGLAFADVKMDLATMVTVTCKPVDAGKGQGARFRPREGWEDVRVHFQC